jgi:uncharacterized protein
MTGKKRLSRWLVGAALLAAVDVAGLAALELAVSSPAQAQLFGDDRFPFLSRQRPQRPSGGGFFGGFFGGGQRQFDNYEQQAPVDNSRAPSPKKAEPKPDAVAPTTSIVVMGDAMADWLAYGLEDAFADSPEIAVVRKNKIHSGLLRYEAKGDLDWWHVARDLLTQEKANFVVMMLGVSDRQNIRERDLAKEADKKKEKDKDKQAGAGQQGRAEKGPGRRRAGLDCDARDAAQQKGERRDRIPHRPVGGDLFEAHRRDDRRAQEQRHTGILGRPAVDPRHEVDRRRRLSQ